MKLIRHTDADYAAQCAALNRRAQASDHVRDVVANVMHQVQTRGDDAVIEFTAKFDGAELTPATMQVSTDEMLNAVAATEARVLGALEASHRNVSAFALKSLRQPWSMTNEQGAEVGEVYHPFERVGCYVPGGTAPLVSTALMTVSFAAAAGVPEIVVCTPCGRDGTVNHVLLAALKLAGATEIYKIGGSQAIAAMTYGTSTLKPVQKIVGPGNSYVVEAKRQAVGMVSIDLLPGPSEVVILADKTANPAFVAADFLAQAEHGKDSAAGFITDDAALMQAVLDQIATQAATLGRQAMVQTVLDKGGFGVLVRDMAEGIRLVNEYSPEHVVVITENVEQSVAAIRTAGAIFVGNYSPVAVGDFLAGPSHTLPTGGAGKSFPGLMADMFQRRTSIVRLTKESCAKSEPIVRAFSEVEGLDAHGESVSIRLRM
jgi:histidinol dehydrogenase